MSDPVGLMRDYIQARSVANDPDMSETTELSARTRMQKLRAQLAAVLDIPYSRVMQPRLRTPRD